MEIKIDRETLLRGIYRVQGILEKRSNMPILSSVLLSAKGDKLKISATDLEVSFEKNYPAKVIKSGDITLSGKRLLDISREANSNEIHIVEKENNWVYISDGNAHYNLSFLPPDEFPVLTGIESDCVFIEIDGKTFSEMINKTIYATTMEESGFRLSGVFLENIQSDNNVYFRMVSTDGHRLSLIDKKVKDTEKLEMKNGIMIPKKSLIELNKFVLEEETILIGLQKNNFIAKKNESLIVIRLLDSKFPDYKTMLPEKKKDDILITIPKKNLLDTMRRMMIVGGDQYKGVIFNISEDCIEMISENPDLGDVKEKIDITYKGKTIKAGFNPKYFIDALQPLESETIFLNIKDENSPCFITGEIDDGFLGLIMPIRI
jgi:DNA polymerase III subunit beta